MAQFTRYKGLRKNKLTVRIPAAGTSQECSKCGHTHPDNRKTQALFLCTSCGFTMNADDNSALIIKKRGIAALLNGEVKVKARKSVKFRKAAAGSVQPVSASPGGVCGSPEGSVGASSVVLAVQEATVSRRAGEYLHAVGAWRIAKPPPRAHAQVVGSSQALCSLQKWSIRRKAVTSCKQEMPLKLRSIDHPGLTISVKSTSQYLEMKLENSSEMLDFFQMDEETCRRISWILGQHLDHDRITGPDLPPPILRKTDGRSLWFATTYGKWILLMLAGGSQDGYSMLFDGDSTRQIREAITAYSSTCTS